VCSKNGGAANSTNFDTIQASRLGNDRVIFLPLIFVWQLPEYGGQHTPSHRVTIERVKDLQNILFLYITEGHAEETQTRRKLAQNTTQEQTIAIHSTLSSEGQCWLMEFPVVGCLCGRFGSHQMDPLEMIF
jgi:hypothetical protein